MKTNHNDNAMEVACQLDEIRFEFHLNAIFVLIWCHIMSFATKILFNLFKAIKKIAITCLIYNLRKKKKKKLVVFR
jgi:hypothetical protein